MDHDPSVDQCGQGKATTQHRNIGSLCINTCLWKQYAINNRLQVGLQWHADIAIASCNLEKRQCIISRFDLDKCVSAQFSE